MRDMWIRSYMRTYVERDVRQLMVIKDLRQFESFLGYLAANHGQTFNASTIGRKTGTSSPSVKSWLGILEASYVVYLLRPYFENFGKRVIKTPKMYFLDPLFAAYLTRQPSAEALIAGAMGGVFFEGLIVCEAVKMFASRGMDPDLYYWRSHDGLELDLIIRLGERLLPIEIKLTATPRAKHIEPLKTFMNLAGNKTTDVGALVCRVDRPRQVAAGITAIPWNGFSRWLADKIDLLA